MSIFNDDKLTISKSFAEAIVKTAGSGIEANTEKVSAITEEMVMIPGYGMMSRDRAVIEAQTSHRNAEAHMKMGNHQGASYHHKRAAMFHDALANAEGTTQQANPGRTATTAEATQPTSVESVNEGKEPHERHNEGKVRRALSRKFKAKDKEKNERKSVEEQAVTEGFKGLKHGDRVTFKTPQGQERTGTVNGLLVSHSHAVVDCGGRHGTPAVVNDKNYVSHKSKGVKEETVAEANQEPHESHLESKFKHAQRRKLRMKTRESDKKDRKEDRYK